MPRPTEETSKGKTCWERTTTQAKVLLLLIVISLIVIVVLIFIIARKQQVDLETICSTETCLIESAKLADHINTDINPCDDFYQFACGRYLELAHGDESLSLSNLVASQAKRQLLEAYREPINESEHEMVIFAKKLFRACMNENEIEKDDLNTIKELIEDLGGWPVVEGPKWDERSFDWIETTFRLREYGYPFAIFLGLTVNIHPRNFSRYIFKVETPELWDYSTRHFDKIQLMAELAEIFGASDKNRALQDMTKAYDFLTKLQLEIHNTYTLGAPSTYTIEQYQNQNPSSINWLHFIQNLIGPIVEVSEKDEVLFPPPRMLNSWLHLIDRTPKRTQANYMLWKVVEKALPYLTDDLRSYALTHRSRETRDQFCLREIQERLIPSPIDIICDRTYLPKEKKDKLDDLLQDIKIEFEEGISNIKWMDTKEKQKALNIAKNVKIIIGKPQDYFDDQILNELNIDVVETKKETFLNLLAVANRNHQNMLFNQTKMSPIDNVYDKWYIKASAGLPVYSGEDNILYIPTTGVNFLYDEARPNYLNYGMLGTYIGNLLSVIVTKYMPISEFNRYHEKFSDKTKKGAEENIKCLQKLFDIYDKNGTKSDFAVQQHVAGVISHRAYQKWTKRYGNEKELIGTNYGPNRVYWISQAFVYCSPSGYYGRAVSTSELVSMSVANNNEFAKDFKCDEKDKMNPSKRCLII